MNFERAVFVLGAFWSLVIGSSAAAAQENYVFIENFTPLATRVRQVGSGTLIMTFQFGRHPIAVLLRALRGVNPSSTLSGVSIRSTHPVGANQPIIYVGNSVVKGTNSKAVGTLSDGVFEGVVQIENHEPLYIQSARRYDLQLQGSFNSVGYVASDLKSCSSNASGDTFGLKSNATLRNPQTDWWFAGRGPISTLLATSPSLASVKATAKSEISTDRLRASRAPALVLQGQTSSPPSPFTNATSTRETFAETARTMKEETVGNTGMLSNKTSVTKVFAKSNTTISIKNKNHTSWIGNVVSTNVTLEKADTTSAAGIENAGMMSKEHVTHEATNTNATRVPTGRDDASKVTKPDNKTDSTILISKSESTTAVAQSVGTSAITGVTNITTKSDAASTGTTRRTDGIITTKVPMTYITRAPTNNSSLVPNSECATIFARCGANHTNTEGASLTLKAEGNWTFVVTENATLSNQSSNMLPKTNETTFAAVSTDGSASKESTRSSAKSSSSSATPKLNATDGRIEADTIVSVSKSDGTHVTVITDRSSTMAGIDITKVMETTGALNGTPLLNLTEILKFFNEASNMDVANFLPKTGGIGAMTKTDNNVVLDQTNTTTKKSTFSVTTKMDSTNTVSKNVSATATTSKSDGVSVAAKIGGNSNGVKSDENMEIAKTVSTPIPSTDNKTSMILKSGTNSVDVSSMAKFLSIALTEKIICNASTEETVGTTWTGNPFSTSLMPKTGNTTLIAKAGSTGSITKVDTASTEKTDVSTATLYVDNVTLTTKVAVTTIPIAKMNNSIILMEAPPINQANHVASTNKLLHRIRLPSLEIESTDSGHVLISAVSAQQQTIRLPAIMLLPSRSSLPVDNNFGVGGRLSGVGGRQSSVVTQQHRTEIKNYAAFTHGFRAMPDQCATCSRRILYSNAWMPPQVSRLPDRILVLPKVPRPRPFQYPPVDRGHRYNNDGMRANPEYLLPPESVMEERTRSRFDDRHQYRPNILSHPSANSRAFEWRPTPPDARKCLHRPPGLQSRLSCPFARPSQTRRGWRTRHPNKGCSTRCDATRNWKQSCHPHGRQHDPESDYGYESIQPPLIMWNMWRAPLGSTNRTHSNSAQYFPRQVPRGLWCTDSMMYSKQPLLPAKHPQYNAPAYAPLPPPPQCAAPTVCIFGTPTCPYRKFTYAPAGQPQPQPQPQPQQRPYQYPVGPTPYCIWPGSRQTPPQSVQPISCLCNAASTACMGHVTYAPNYPQPTLQPPNYPQPSVQPPNYALPPITPCPPNQVEVCQCASSGSPHNMALSCQCRDKSWQAAQVAQQAWVNPNPNPYVPPGWGQPAWPGAPAGRWPPSVRRCLPKVCASCQLLSPTVICIQCTPTLLTAGLVSATPPPGPPTVTLAPSPLSTCRVTHCNANTGMMPTNAVNTVSQGFYDPVPRMMFGTMPAHCPHSLPPCTLAATPTMPPVTCVCTRPSPCFRMTEAVVMTPGETYATVTTTCSTPAPLTTPLCTPPCHWTSYAHVLMYTGTFCPQCRSTSIQVCMPCNFRGCRSSA